VQHDLRDRVDRMCVSEIATVDAALDRVFSDHLNEGECNGEDC
jgi:hypothetical protein